MLKGIPPVLSPELLKVLCEMGHGDELVIADGNFPAANVGKNSIVIRADGHGTVELLDAILQLMPLDSYVDKAAAVMAVVPGDSEPTPPIWEAYSRILRKYEPEQCEPEQIERFAFYKRSSAAYAIIATGEPAAYANILLKKGVVRL